MTKNVTVELDEKVAADILALISALSWWGEDWHPMLGRSEEAITPLRDVITYETAQASIKAVTEFALTVNQA